MVDLICTVCEKKFSVYKYRKDKARYCSYACKYKDFSILSAGENNPAWTGGLPICKDCGKRCAKYGAVRCNMCNFKLGKQHWKGGISFTKERHAYYDHKAKMKRRNVEGSHSQEEWEKLKKTYHYMCLCCKRQESEIKLSKDHIIPIIVGGTDYIWNIQPLCRSCNSIKHAKIIDYREGAFQNSVL
jgi:5-methylcytosine-specific restriction endonuclease McrA